MAALVRENATPWARYRRDEKQNPVTHADLVDIAEHWLMSTKQCSFVLRELHSLSDTGEIPDCLGFRVSAGRSILIECKTSRRDFLSDSGKMFRQHPEMGVGSFRFYMAPTGVVSPEELPPKWGLIVVNNRGKAKQVAGPRAFYGHPTNDAYLFRDCNIAAEWQMMASALRRVHLRGDLPKIYLGNRIKTNEDKIPAIFPQEGARHG